MPNTQSRAPFYPCIVLICKTGNISTQGFWDECIVHIGISLSFFFTVKDGLDFGGGKEVRDGGGGGRVNISDNVGTVVMVRIIQIV